MINIGTRQNRRLRSSNVTDINYNVEEIIDSVNKVMKQNIRKKSKYMVTEILEKNCSNFIKSSIDFSQNNFLLMKKIVVIPARSGSKGIPNKNIMKFAGRSLVSYALDSACESKLVDEIILTSDSEEILNFSKDYVNITPHKRTNSLSSDKSPVVDTIKELISLNGYNDYDIIILLQPTSPLRTGTHIDSAIDLFLKNKMQNH